jgi:hypothetical protein
MYCRVHVCRYFKKSSKICWTVLCGGKGGRGSSRGDIVCFGRRYSLNLVPGHNQKNEIQDMVGRITIRLCSTVLPSPARMCCQGPPLHPQHERIHCCHNRSRRVFWHPPRRFHLVLGNWETSEAMTISVNPTSYRLTPCVSGTMPGSRMQYETPLNVVPTSMATINLRREPLYGFLVDMVIGRQAALRSIAPQMFVQPGPEEGSNRCRFRRS